MLNIPTESVSQEDLNTWFLLQKQLEDIRVKEMALRKKIFVTHFPTPIEGTNIHPLSEGWILKAQHKITRDVDLALLNNLTAELRTKNIPLDSLIRYKPELVTSQYRNLTNEERLLFDQILNIKIGSPSLEIVSPKKPK